MNGNIEELLFVIAICGGVLLLIVICSFLYKLYKKYNHSEYAEDNIFIIV
jgi:hypothetical protein